MNSVPGALGIDASQDRHSKQCEVTDYVHDLVAHKLVGEPEPFTIQDAAFGSQHDRILERPSAREAEVAQRFDLIQKTKRARRRNLFCELPVAQFDVPALRADHRVWKLNQTRYRKNFSGLDAHSSIALRHFNVFQNAEELARRFELGDSRLFD